MRVNPQTWARPGFLTAPFLPQIAGALSCCPDASDPFTGAGSPFSLALLLMSFASK